MKKIFLILILLFLIIISGCCINQYYRIYDDKTIETGTEYKFLFLTWK